MSTITGLMTSVLPNERGRMTRLSDLAQRAVAWPFMKRGRFMLLFWLIGIFMIGATSMAHADDLFIGPPGTTQPATSSAATPFERYDTADYTFLYSPDSNNDGFAGGKGLINETLNGVEIALFWVGASIIRGALIAMQWLLGLDLYADNSDQINSAVTDVTNKLMIPMLSITLVIAGFTAYARHKKEKSGFDDFSWIAASTILALGFGLFPGTVIGLADGVRAFVGTQVMTIYADVAGDDKNALGVNNGADIPGNQQCGKAGNCEQQTARNGSRMLVNTLWDSWVNTPWCYAQFKSLATCKAVDTISEAKADGSKPKNSEVILDQDLREALTKKLGKTPYDEISNGGKYEPWNGNDRWIRGESPARFGAVLFFFLVSVPIAALLLGLTIFGLLAAIGLLLLVIVGPFFLMMWMIPGIPRRIGMQWLHSVIAVLMQSVLITLVLGAVAIVTAILNSKIQTYGYFMAALFNLVVIVTAWRLRAQMEQAHLSASGGGSLGMSSSMPVSSYMAMRALSATTRAGKKTVKSGAKVAAAPVVASYNTGRGIAAISDTRAMAPLKPDGSKSGVGLKGLKERMATSTDNRAAHISVPGAYLPPKPVPAGANTPAPSARHSQPSSAGTTPAGRHSQPTGTGTGTGLPKSVPTAQPRTNVPAPIISRTTSAPTVPASTHSTSSKTPQEAAGRPRAFPPNALPAPISGGIRTAPVRGRETPGGVTVMHERRAWFERGEGSSRP